ncbi:MAG TPA: tetratricopeptide repeat protein [Candidatus Hydrogenedentes bacterium]|nr:tetratricopeptide repeat protein [Candidatus Hydrogenedentota bacterium]
MYFVPVYELANYMPVEFALLKHRFSNTPLVNVLIHPWGTNRFMGIKLLCEDAPSLIGVYRVANQEAFPWLLYLRTATPAFQLCGRKHTRFEKEFRAVWIEIRLLAGGNTEKAVAAYFELLNRYPGHERFARRIEALAADMTDYEARARTLFALGRYMPDQAGVLALDIAAIADMMRERNGLDRAETLYRQALMLAPHDRSHQVKLADVLLERGEPAAALENYRAVLRAAPESPYTAARFDQVCMAQENADALLQFWRELHHAHPEAAVPALRLGRELERRGNLDEARSLYEHVEIHHPENMEAVLRRGVLVALSESYAKGRGMMDKAVDVNPDMKPEFVAGLARIAEQYTKTGAHAFAEAIYREAMELAPEDGWHQVHYAEALMAQENYALALDVFADILRRDPESPYSARKTDEIFERTGASEERLAIWEELHELHPHAFVPALHLGKALESAGRHAEALQQYRVVHEIHADKPEAALRLGALTARFEDYEAGRALMEAALASAPKLETLFVALLAGLAEHFVAANELERAEMLYRELSARAPAELWYPTRLADVLVRREQYEEALELYRHVIRQAPESPHSATQIDAIYARRQDENGRVAEWRSLCAELPGAVIPHLHLGMAREAIGQLEEARAVYEDALARAPENALLQLRFGVLAAILEDYEKGRALMDAVLVSAPELRREMASGLAEIALRKQNEGQYAAAESLYREAIALAPEDGWHQVRLGELLIARERYEEARELFVDLLVKRPESPHTAALLDKVYAKQGNDGKRLKCWREIVEQQPHAATPRYHLGLALERSGMTEDALDAFIEALRIKPDYQEAREALKRLTATEE